MTFDFGVIMYFFIPTSDARAIKLASLLKKNERIPQLGLKSVTVLPIPFSTDGVYLSKSDMKIEALFERVKDAGLYIGYGLPEKLSALIEENGGIIIDVEKSESFLLKNAYLTAQGALGYILTEFNKVPKDLKVGIIGLGRIGKEILKLLLFMNSSVCIYTRGPTKGLFLAQNDIDARLVSYENPDDYCHGFKGLDVLINTAPKRLIGKMDLDDLKDTAVIELASGKNMPNGLKYTPLMSIPANMYPSSGGKVYYEAAMENLLFLEEKL